MTEQLNFVYNIIKDLDKGKYEVVLKKLSDYFKTDQAFILDYHNTSKTTDVLLSDQMSDQNKEYLKNIIPSNFKNIKFILDKGQPLIINQRDQGTKYKKVYDILDRFNKESLVLIPIDNESNGIIGVLGLVDTQKKLWDNTKLKILEIVACNLKYFWEDEIIKFKYQSIIQNSTSAVVILDNEGFIVELNKKFVKLAEAKKDELINRKCFFDFIEQVDKDKMITRHKKRREGIDIPSDYNFHFISAKGNKKEVNIKVEIIPGTDKSVCSLIDITAEKNNEKIIKLQEKRLTESYDQLKKNRGKLEELYMDLIDKNIENERLISNIEKLINLVSSLNISDQDDLNNFLADLLYTALEIVDVADYGSVFVFDQEGYIQYIETVGHNLQKLNDIEIDKNVFIDNFDQIEIIDNILERNYQTLDRYIADRIKEASLPIKQSIPVILYEKENVYGGICIDIALGNDKNFSKDDIRLISSFRNLANTFFKLERYKRLNKKFNKEVVSSLLNFLNQYDIYTNHHSENVAELSLEIADRLKLSNEEKNDTYWTGMLHDLGKLIIPNDILNKKGSFNKKEYEVIKKHPEYCYQALKDSEFLKDVAIYVYHHHESWDGKGYPDGLQGDQIPLISRIIAVADSWDAMRSKRAYRKSMSKEQAKKELLKNKGVQFDPEIVNILLEIKKCKVERTKEDE